MKTLLRMFDKISKPEAAHAHCDIPCGIYETDSAKTAAHTVWVMTDKLLKLDKPREGDLKSKLDFLNNTTRFIKEKEEHAQKCKKELWVLWSDYFKPEHLKAHPDLHEKFWMATKQCSSAKREVNLQTAQKLKDMVDEIEQIYKSTKK